MFENAKRSRTPTQHDLNDVEEDLKLTQLVNPTVLYFVFCVFAVTVVFFFAAGFATLLLKKRFLMSVSFSYLIQK